MQDMKQDKRLWDICKVRLDAELDYVNSSLKFANKIIDAKRKGSIEIYNLIEEIAEQQVMLDMLKVYYGIYDYELKKEKEKFIKEMEADL